MERVRDRLWLWGHKAGSYNGNVCRWGFRDSRMTAVEAAGYLGIPNLYFCVFGNEPRPAEFRQYAVAMRPLREVAWSIVGDGGSVRNNEATDLEPVLELARDFPNITRAVLDDFFLEKPDAQGKIARWPADAVKGFQTALGRAPRPLSLWGGLYTDGIADRDGKWGQLALPADRLRPYLDALDGVMFLKWYAKNLSDLPSALDRLDELAPKTPRTLGLYLYDYGDKREMPLDRMKFQAQLGLDWLRAGRIEEITFVASCFCDLEYEAVEWTRAWIREVGGEPLPLRPARADVPD